jgi:hypothetical protein
MKIYDAEEIKDGEVFVANKSTIRNNSDELFAIWKKHLKTIRLGEQAYDLDGNKLDPERHRPIFVHKDELDELNRLWQEQIDKIKRQYH